MKKGFTLVELLAVIMVIGIIATVSVISIRGSIDRANERLYQEQISRLESNLQSWSTNNISMLPVEDGVSFFSIERLVAEGIINTDEIIDPRSDGRIDGCVVITFDEYYNQYNFKYEEDNCDVTTASYMPTIDIKNGTSQTVEVNETYVFSEIEAFDHEGSPLQVIGPIITEVSTGETVRRLDTSILSSPTDGPDFILSYITYDEKLSLETIEEVELKIVDTVRPVIELLDSTITSDIVFEAAPTFEFPEAIVRDNSCGLSMEDDSVNNCHNTLDYSVTTSIIPTVPGQYSVTYTASDYYGNTRNLVLNVEVVDTSN